MRFATDKISHGYLPSYLAIAARVGTAGRVCEIGVQSGASLHMWQALFPDGQVAGVDHDANATWPDGTERIVMGQADPGLPDALKAISPQWDLIVEDASHEGKLSEITFGLLWPLVAPGGFYAVEDWMVGLGGWPGYDDSMLCAARSFLKLLTAGSDTVSVTYTYGLAVIEKRG